ncbi:MAG: DHHA1 domain-containing protein [Candidatus Nanoarchaeia archaeon]|nr:DHHA1 domain-containing protein [Candidatus Nanoarchaeia archaeon]
MISEKKLKEIRDYIEKSENPLVLYDDDPDGLCSYLIFKKMKEHAKGIIIKSSPVLDELYLKKVEEISPDMIFVFDKPIISQDFIDQIHVPIIWLDHHPLVERKGVHYYNPRQEDEKDNSPASYWVYNIYKNKELMWLAAIGSVADWYVPDFLEEFKKNYPNLIDKQKTPDKILFESRFGELVRVFAFLLKGKSLDIRKNIAVILKLKDPYEILDQTTSKGKFLYNRYLRVKKQYDELLQQAQKAVISKKILLFLYPSVKMSFTAELSNELLYKNPDKLIIIGREKGDEVKLSFRSAKLILPPIIEKALINVKGYGGGHDHAAGGNVSKDDFQTFIDNIKNQIE